MNSNVTTFKIVATQEEVQEILTSLLEVRNAWEKSLSFNEMNKIFSRCDKILNQYKK